jgi:hypothetical protein
MRTASKALLAIGFAACGAIPTSAQPQTHVALVLDNGKTQTAPAPHTTRIAEGLGRMNYRVIFGRQQDQAGMRRYINEFRGALNDAQVALFYFKGVSLDASGRNLLMASNAAPGRPIEHHAVPLDEIADLMTASRANVLLIDAGYADRTAEAFSGVSPAMARIRHRPRFMVAFANMPGKIGRSDAESPFADVVASYLANNDITSANLGLQLRLDVFERTRGSQLPWVRSDLGEVRLAALPPAPIAPPLPPSLPPAFDRTAAIRDIQTELQRHQCYKGAINGDATQTQRVLESFGRNQAANQAPEITLASADIQVLQPLCAPPAPPPAAVPPPVSQPTPKRVPPAVSRPRPAPRVVEQEPRSVPRPAQRIERSSGGGSGSGGGGGGGFTFTPTR